MENVRLVEALRRFASPTHQDHTVIVIDSRVIPLSAVCSAAADYIEKEKLERLKMRALVSGMKKYGMGEAYEMIMGEKIPEGY